jgi:uncharacterized protein (TIGR03067 family)
MKMRMLLIVSVGLLVGADDAKDDVKKDQDKMQGTWKLVSGEQNGEAIPEDVLKTGKLVVTGDKYTIKFADYDAEGTQKIDPTKKPKTIDSMNTGGQGQGQTFQGIYEVHDETLKQCFGEPGGDRPTEFTTKSGNGRYMFVWKKAKD